MDKGFNPEAQEAWGHAREIAAFLKEVSIKDDYEALLEQNGINEEVVELLAKATNAENYMSMPQSERDKVDSAYEKLKSSF